MKVLRALARKSVRWRTTTQVLPHVPQKIEGFRGKEKLFSPGRADEFTVGASFQKSAGLIISFGRTFSAAVLAWQLPGAPWRAESPDGAPLTRRASRTRAFAASNSRFVLLQAGTPLPRCVGQDRATFGRVSVLRRASRGGNRWAAVRPHFRTPRIGSG